MSLISFGAANHVGDRFLDLLSRFDIKPPLGSGIESELLSLTELIEVAKNPALVKDPSRRVSILRAAIGLEDLAAKVLSIEHLPEFSVFLPHLRLDCETVKLPPLHSSKMPEAGLLMTPAERPRSCTSAA